MELLDVYDENGRPTGAFVERREAHRKGICHKVIHVWILNANNELLIQRRSKVKDLHPDQWYVSLGGHIERGESNRQTAIREFQEELGLDVSDKVDQIRYLYTFKERIIADEGAFLDYAFYDVHLLRTEVNVEALILQAEEVQEVKWMAYADFQAAILRRDPDFWIHEEGFAMLFDRLDEIIAGKPSRSCSL